jgi:hypothetical protein
MIAQGFADPGTRDLFSVLDGVPALLERLGQTPRGTAVVGGRT